MKNIVMTIGVLAALAGGVNAAPLNTAQVGADAKFVVHLDVDALKTTQAGKLLLQRTSTGAENNKLNALAAILGFDLRKDVSGVTVFGAPNAGDEGVIVFNGRFDGQQLVTFVKANDGYTSDSYKGTTVHSWTDEKKNNKRTYGVVIGGSTIAMSDKKSALHAALDAIGGGDSIASQNASKLALGGAKDAVLLAAADLAQVNKGKPANAQTLKQAKSGVASIREDGDEMVVSIGLEADTVENAQLMNNAVRGLLAIVQLDEKTDQKTKDAFAGAKVELQGTSLSASMRMPAKVLVDAMQKKMQEEDARKQATKVD